MPYIHPCQHIVSFRSVADQVVARADELSPQNMSNIVNAFAKLEYTDPHVFDEIAPRVRASLWPCMRSAISVHPSCVFVAIGISEGPSLQPAAAVQCGQRLREGGHQE